MTGLSTHAHTAKHTFNFSDYEFLGRESNESKRKLLEIIYIIRHDNTTNFVEDSQSLSNVYNFVLKEF